MGMRRALCLHHKVVDHRRRCLSLALFLLFDQLSDSLLVGRLVDGLDQFRLEFLLQHRVLGLDLEPGEVVGLFLGLLTEEGLVF